MKGFRARYARGCGFLAAFAGGALLLPLYAGNAAEGTGAADAGFVATPPAGAEKSGLREPSAGGPVIIRGTRPEVPNVGRAALANAGGATPATEGAFGFSANFGFQPVLGGNGWDARYDYRGFDVPVTPR